MKCGRRERAAQLALRREALVAEGQSQRAAIRVSWAQLELPLRWLDVAVKAARYVRAHPWAPALPLLAIALFAPRRLGRTVALLASGVRLWRLLRR